MDHYSRHIMGTTHFWWEPSSPAMCAFLGRAIHAANAKPKQLVIDKEPQFWCKGFKDWCRKKESQPRFGALGRHGSTAVTERLILTLKQNLAWLPLIPLRRRVFRRQILELAEWYKGYRPHMSLGGQTPQEVYRRQRLANRQRRLGGGRIPGEA
jgi:transposase InsO family protein